MLHLTPTFEAVCGALESKGLPREIAVEIATSHCRELQRERWAPVYEELLKEPPFLNLSEKLMDVEVDYSYAYRLPGLIETDEDAPPPPRQPTAFSALGALGARRSEALDRLSDVARMVYDRVYLRCHRCRRSASRSSSGAALGGWARPSRVSHRNAIDLSR